MVQRLGFRKEPRALLLKRARARLPHGSWEKIGAYLLTEIEQGSSTRFLKLRASRV